MSNEPKLNPYGNNRVKKPELLIGSPYQKERPRHIIACNIYLSMGQGRSLAKLHQFLAEAAQENGGRVPVLRSLKQWSSDFEWQQRALDYDNQQVRLQQEKNQQLAEKFLGDGLALAQNRVARLTEVEDLLFSQIKDPELLWIVELKNIRTDEGGFTATPVKQFNGSLIFQWRGILDDIAKETGGRKEVVQHTGDANSPVVMNLTTMRLLQEQAAQELEEFEPYEDGGLYRKDPFDEK